MNYCNFTNENAIELKSALLNYRNNFTNIEVSINLIEKKIKELLSQFCDEAASSELIYYREYLISIENDLNHAKYELDNTPTKTTITEVYKDYNGESRTISKEIPINSDLIYDLKNKIKGLEEKKEECIEKVEFLEYYIDKYASIKKYLIDYLSNLKTKMYLLSSIKDRFESFLDQIFIKINKAIDIMEEFENMTKHNYSSNKSFVRKIK